MTRAAYVYGLIGTVLALASRLTPAETILLVPFVSASLAYISSYFLETRREKFERQQRIDRLMERETDQDGKSRPE